METLSPTPFLQFTDANGSPLSGGKLYTYAAGTTTPLATYTDSTGGSSNTNPVILDSRGQAAVWLSSSAYKFVLKDSTDVTIKTTDNIIGSGLSGIATAYQTATAGQTAFTISSYGTGGYLQVTVNGLVQRVGASYDYVETSGTVITFNSGLSVGDVVGTRMM